MLSFTQRSTAALHIVIVKMKKIKNWKKTYQQHFSKQKFYEKEKRKRSYIYNSGYYALKPFHSHRLDRHGQRHRLVWYNQKHRPWWMGGLTYLREWIYPQPRDWLFVKYPTEYQSVIKNHSLYWGLFGNIFYIVLYYMVKVAGK